MHCVDNFELKLLCLKIKQKLFMTLSYQKSSRRAIINLFFMVQLQCLEVASKSWQKLWSSGRVLG